MLLHSSTALPAVDERTIAGQLHWALGSSRFESSPSPPAGRLVLTGGVCIEDSRPAWKEGLGLLAENEGGEVQFSCCWHVDSKGCHKHTSWQTSQPKWGLYWGFCPLNTLLACEERWENCHSETWGYIWTPCPAKVKNVLKVVAKSEKTATCLFSGIVALKIVVWLSIWGPTNLPSQAEHGGFHHDAPLGILLG